MLALPSRPVVRLAAALSFWAVAPALPAQVTLSHIVDAAPIPVGVLRVNVTNGWGRYDERFTASGTRALGDELSTDSLGPRQFPALLPAEAGLQTLSNDPRTRLTLGRLAAISNVRTVTTPIALEYGLTRRLSIGILIPVVQTRRAHSLVVNKDSGGNVTFIPSRSRTEAANANQAVYAALSKAADSLGTLITRCPSNPSASGCGAVNANPSDAASARAQALAFANAVRSGLGTDTSTTLVAPRSGSTLATAIDAQRTAINTRLQAYLGAGAGAVSGVFTSSSPFTYIDLQGTSKSAGLLQGPIGGGLDSIYTINPAARINAPSFGAQFLLFDRFQHDTLPPGHMQSRMMIGGSFRFASPLADTLHTTLGVLSDVGAAVEAHSALDVISGRLGATVGVRYVQPFASTVFAPLFGDPEAAYPVPVFGLTQRTAGATIGLDLTPRYLIGDWFSVDGLYGFERTGAATYAPASVTPCANCEALIAASSVGSAHMVQRLGFGFRYSTVESTARGKTGFPVEISFSHLDTITGDAGAPKLSRDQIQVRLFFRLRDQ
ncbi:MAG: hypothetical protein JWM95_1040 [Gemmatimonadetes bacterium]|nr:hypothetical protein [Gemmatimonadota bacterium]